MSLTKVTNSMILGAAVNVLDYGANTTPGTTNMAPAINAAIVAAGNGGTVWFPKGVYNVESPILAEDYQGLTLIGEIATNPAYGSTIVGKHTGKAILSLVGSVGVTISGLALQGSSVMPPKTGLLLGRSSASSAGNHTFYNIAIRGDFTVCALYNVASEDTVYLNCIIYPNLAPVAAMYMSQVDGESIGGLTGSSMETCTMIGGYIGNSDSTATSTALKLMLGSATGHHRFYGVFFVKSAGESYITMQMGASDGSSTYFPIGFYDCCGENSGTSPTNGFLIKAGAGGLELGGFSLRNFVVATGTGLTNLFNCDTTFNNLLIGADISVPAAATGAVTIGNMSGSRLATSGTATAVVSTAKGCDFSGSVTITSDLGGNTVRNVTGGQYQIKGPTYLNTKAVITAATYSLGVTDSTLIFSGASSNCTVTLLPPSSCAGMMLHLLQYSATYSVVSATANVTPLIGGAASTSILPATVGKWCTLQSDGASWAIISGN